MSQIDNDQTEPSAYSVGEVYGLLNDALKKSLSGEVWIKGIIRDFSQAPSKHHYFSLTDDGIQPGQVPSESLNAALFAGTWAKIQPRLKAANLNLENGIEVQLRGEIGIYKARSQIQIIVKDIDPNYTISKLSQNREQLLAKLMETGLLELNKQKALPLLPLKVALVTSANSAACQDFLKQLEESGYSWDVNLVHSSVQGSEAIPELLEALKTASRIAPDVIAIVRGGGSNTDLAAFDDESAAVAVANSPIPVFCGIGHEINTSVLDSVVHTSTKTPTACAQELNALVNTAELRAQEAFEDVCQNARHLLQRQQSQLQHLITEASHKPREDLKNASLYIHTQKVSLTVLSQSKIKAWSDYLTQKNTTLKNMAQDTIESLRNKLSFNQNQIKILDPKNFLSRGWSITKTSSGSLIKSPENAPPGTQLITQLAEGEINSTVD